MTLVIILDVDGFRKLETYYIYLLCTTFNMECVQCKKCVLVPTGIYTCTPINFLT